MTDIPDPALCSALAEKHARTHPRDKGAPAHWLRCNQIRLVDGISFRCLKGEGHTDRHQYVDEAEHDEPSR